MLLAELSSLNPSLKASEEKALVGSLNKALALALAGIELNDARECSTSVRKQIYSCLADCLTLSELKKVSKKWEPKRTVSSSIAQSELVEDLKQLAEREREPFVPSKLTLNAALSALPADRIALEQGIMRFATPAQLKSMLKKWDKHANAPSNLSATQLRDQLLSLLHGKVTPAPKPPKQKY